MVNKDVPGFVVNRILVALNSAACLLVANNVYSIVEVDSAVKYRLVCPWVFLSFRTSRGG